LQEEERGIVHAGIATGASDSDGLRGFAEAAGRNADLANELISATEEQSRPAQLIVPDLMKSITDLRAALARLPADPRVSPDSLPSRQALNERR
jgi:hypothetical protein